MSFFSVFLVSFVLSGCRAFPSPLQLYPGPELPKSEVAILMIYFNELKSPIMIDGRDITEDVYNAWRAHVEQNPRSQTEYTKTKHTSACPYYVPVAILPGKHEISWNYKSFSFAYRSLERLTVKGAGTLDAKAGKRYQMVLNYELGDLISRDGTATEGYVSTYKVKSYNTRIDEYKPSFGTGFAAGQGCYETEDFTPH